MAYIFEEPSHTFDEYLLVPGYTGPDCIPANVSLQTPVVRYNKKNWRKMSFNDEHSHDFSCYAGCF